MAAGPIRVRGLRALQRDFKKMSKDLSKSVDNELKEAGDVVAQEARSLFMHYDARSAVGFRPRVRGFGRVVVEQRRRRTTGKRGDYGSLQMQKALIPGLWHKADEVERVLERMLDRLAGRYRF